MWPEKAFCLSNGVKIPCIGLGTFRIKGQDNVEAAVTCALNEGYELIDTAAVYRNEAFIASSLEKSSFPRDKLFFTSKLAPKDHGAEKARAAFEKTLANLKTDHLDLYLIHWPGVHGLKVDDPKNKTLRQESWAVLESLYNEGRVKAIGVSNYEIGHLSELLEFCKVAPHVNQIEVHPHFQQRPLVEFCRSKAIHVTAYSSLGTTVNATEDNALLTDPVVIDISKEKGLSVAQVLLLWALQKGLSVVPKSTNPLHIKENISLYHNHKLDEGDIEALDGLEKGQKYAWNPSSVL